MISLSLLGVLFAFPLKRRFINDEQYPFPEGRACGIVLDALHGERRAARGCSRRRSCSPAGGLSALIELLRSEKVIELIRMPFLQDARVLGRPGLPLLHAEHPRASR